MLKTVEGIYRAGKVELLEMMPDVKDAARVLVTFLPENSAWHIKGRIASYSRVYQNKFDEDQEQPEIDIYEELFGPLTGSE
jgi:hypothetical protein